MTLTLNELLMLVGRLDDATGFDAPRERFRRFLLEHITDVHVARTLIERCQYAPGDQHRRALLDLVVVLGRCLGFDPKFGSHPGAPSVRIHGRWHSRQLDVVLEIRTDPLRDVGVDELSHSVDTLNARLGPARFSRALGLCILTPLYTTQRRIENIQIGRDPDSRIRITTLKPLLSTAEMMGAGYLTHDDFVRLLESRLGLDFLVGLLERASGSAARRDSMPGGPSAGRQEGRSHWLATIGMDQGTPAEEFVENVIAKRQILGIDEGTSPDAPQPGDFICFHVPGRGVVGHCQVRTPNDDGRAIRGANRFSQLLQLDDVIVHLDAPASLGHELQLRVHAARTEREPAPYPVIRISRQEYEELTSTRQVDARSSAADGGIPFPGAEPEPPGQPVSVAGSRSDE